MTKRVCIDAGHGGAQPGASYSGLLEKDVVLKVAKYSMLELQVLDPLAYVCLTRSWDETLTLQQRCDLADNMNVDCFVSIHCNADPDSDEPGMPEAKGEEIWFYKGSSRGFRLAQSLASEVDQVFSDEPFRGIKETDALYVLKHTNMPSALIEIGFIDKSSSMETFTDEVTLRKIGLLIARGINGYFELP